MGLPMATAPHHAKPAAMNRSIRLQSKKRWWPIAVAAAVCATIGLLHWATSERTKPSGAEAPPGWAWLSPGVGQGSAATPPNASHTSDTVRPPHVLRAVLQAGSFAGTRPRGGWCVNGVGALEPCLGLRERFEYHINGLGEITEAEVRSLIEDEARREVGELLSQQVMAVYDRYWAVRNHPLRLRVEMTDPSTWLPALREAQMVRRQGLGEAWANAFYAEEDADFVATHERAVSGTRPPPSDRDPVPTKLAGQSDEALRAERVKRYGEEIASELEALDARQMAFDRAVDQARATWQGLQAQQQLSEQDRQAQLKAFVDATFEPQDRRRAMGLATLPRS